MHRQSIRILGWIVFLVTTTVPTVGFADDWTWGPFSKSTASRDSSPLYSKSSAKSSWLPTMKMPTMPWSSKSPRSNSYSNSYSRSNTSTLGKMSKTTKRWWNTTTEWLDPYPEPKPQSYSSSSDSKKSNTNWFTGMFEKEDTNRPMNEIDFLRQPTPQ